MAHSETKANIDVELEHGASARVERRARELKHEPREAEPIAHGPELPAAMVAAPRKAWPWAVDPRVWPWEPPRRVAWQSGILAPRGARVWQRTVKPDWHDKFCRGKHGPC